MAESFSGKVLFERFRASKGVTRFVEKRLRNWFTSHAEHSPLSYDVSFRREGPGHLISCTVEFHARAALWRGAAVASGVHQALIQCMQRLIQIPIPTPPGGSSLSLAYLQARRGPPPFAA